MIKSKKAQLCKLACQFLGCDGLVVVVDKQLNNNNNNNNTWTISLEASNVLKFNRSLQK